MISCLLARPGRSVVKISHDVSSMRFYASASKAFSTPKTRNIGIIAHIDAGKTTTTERMLYYAGVTKRLGDIDDGDTVMDYLKAERERGITINSAAITFGWKDHRLNLIDTPGHVDFTMEVERSVRVLDGAVTILDGVAGVEAQTETVWRQADRYSLPRLAFVNKLDRTGGAFGRTVQEIWKKLQARPLVTQLPCYYDDATRKGCLAAVIDVVDMKVLEWTSDDGHSWTATALTKDAPTYDEAVLARTALVETLAEMDEAIVDVFFDQADGDHMQVPAVAIKDAIRRVTLDNKAVPVLCGSAFKNIGVQPLLDAIVDYLPSPLDRPAALATINDQRTQLMIPLKENASLCALAFKVTHDPRRGPMVYVKVYAGKLAQRATLFNTTTRSKERANKLLQMYAKDVEEIPAIEAGNIGVIVGLKHTRTGDTLVMANDRQAVKTNLQLGHIDIPSPAFFAAIEPHSVSDEPAVEEALQHLTREDPSLKVWTDEDSGQRLISGMGELHLEIVKDRLINDFKCKADMGKMRISYRESCQADGLATYQYDKEILGKRARASVTVSISSNLDQETLDDNEDKGWASESGNLFKIDLGQFGNEENHQDGAGEGCLSTDEIYQAVHTGLMSGFARGAVLGFPLTRVKVRVSNLEFYGPETTAGAISASVSHAVHQALSSASPNLLEPMMEVVTEVHEADIGHVVADLSGTRRGHVLSMESTLDENRDLDNATEVQHRIKAHVPLSSMLGYSSGLRSLTGGSGSFSMRVIGYGEMGKDRERAVVNEMKGW
ncbi:P-loop containing nucleoside triphosphate hydrolase protein [Hesseltinella vesiculosa]|uniref:Ribosome-releasing factor 2, mitochondrial n=1 Tax=Hesseltinella vesiculosa TaxID=101127 RepID=A0A1X2GP41_9FUNG|nr:P-loop containing nucleoside triphosphate hydrolase protein [Hesseltinella vesiculosa]